MDLLFFDVETTGLDPTKSQLLCIGYGDGEKVTVIAGPEPHTIQAFLDLIQEDTVLVGYNIKGFDIPFLTMRGLINSVGDIHKMHRAYKIDLMRVVKNYMCTGNMRYNLKSICEAVGVSVENDDINGSEVPVCDDIHRIVEHCRRDVERIMELFEVLYPLCTLYFYRKYGFELPEAGV